MARYYADPDGGIITLAEIRKLIRTNDWVRQWSRGSVRNFLTDCIYLGRFVDRHAARRSPEFRRLHEWSPTGECLSY